MFLTQQEAPNPSVSFFKTLDKNNDGLLTREELGPDKEALFNRLVTLSDKNDDGKLTREEFLEGVSPKPATTPAQSGRPGGGARDRTGLQGLHGLRLQARRSDRGANSKDEGNKGGGDGEHSHGGTCGIVIFIAASLATRG